ncbi:MAG TPA: GNAT family N-acetyltransferase [Chitinophagales bacterium]|nr:GNAT family N-acetyltransferase [Chitinophagales bacterium]
MRQAEIIDYSDEYKEAIKVLNYEWLQKYFRVEEGDVVSLGNPQREIIDKGGYIYYARLNGEIVGTASLLKVTGDVYELGKMAVTEKARGQHIGTMLLEHCLHVAQQKGIKKLILYSNTKLANAIGLYRKYGFNEIELEPGHYERANIKMEKML